MVPFPAVSVTVSHKFWEMKASKACQILSVPSEKLQFLLQSQHPHSHVVYIVNYCWPWKNNQRHFSKCYISINLYFIFLSFIHILFFCMYIIPDAPRVTWVWQYLCVGLISSHQEEAKSSFLLSHKAQRQTHSQWGMQNKTHFLLHLALSSYSGPFYGSQLVIGVIKPIAHIV